ncbi:hypothetical protein BH24GEM1_BH24GEM1_02650 [soil metagenome]
MTNESTGTAPVSGASPQKQALLEAFDSVLKKQAEEREAEQREAEERRRSRNRVRPSLWAMVALVMFLCAYLYVERPEWLFPASAPPESVAVREASLRIGMANVAQHLERYRQRTGKLPSTLIEIGTQATGITYEPLDSADWRLVGAHAGVELTLGSREPLSGFLGNSFEVISRRPR